jgi:D-alanyl-D-alanine carboxypeptidase/D-alanyl-D-alanine-endopeptidase (penicillin-binding protein 4)
MVSLIVLLLIPVVGLAAVWQLAEANEPPVTTTTTTTEPPLPVDELTTDLLSYRREPGPLAIDAAEREEAALDDELVGQLTDLIGDGMCVTLRRGDEIVTEVAADAPLIPASNMKLLVAAVALDVLGPDFRFTTELVGPPLFGTAIPGDLFVVGGGDPVLVTADHADPHPHPAINTTALEPLVDQLVAAGVTQIDGDIVGDASRYDDEFSVPGWGDDISNFDAGPYDALMVNDGMIGNGNYGLVPAQSAANIVDDLVRARGIAVAGSSRHADAPPDLVVHATVESLPLTDILIELLHTSDNNTAELLLKEIGYQARGDGTRPAGAAVVGEYLATWGIASPVVLLDDGSGLSRQNRLTCDVLSGVLALAPIADELRSVLPVAARDGTLADEFVGTPADGELQAKTGTLSGVKALSGVMDGADDEPVEFALVMNGDGVEDPAVYEPYWQTLVDVIADYPADVEPDPDRFEPR